VALTRQISRPLPPKGFWGKVRRVLSQCLRILLRSAFLSAVAAPLLLTYPLARADPKLEARHLSLCVSAVEACGAAVTKLFQWAGSRPDLFGQRFSDAFERLQDDTRPHGFGHTERQLERAFGGGWRERIYVDEGRVLGSGCIGQVYMGRVLAGDRKGTEVAVKVLHPNIEYAIDADIDILLAASRLLEALPFAFAEKLAYLNLSGMVEEFADLLKMQLDLRQESDNIELFAGNFAGEKMVRFPGLFKELETSKDVLVMECELRRCRVWSGVAPRSFSPAALDFRPLTLLPLARAQTWTACT
jgi:aarF domain-containing kinase